MLVEHYFMVSLRPIKDEEWRWRRIRRLLSRWECWQPRLYSREGSGTSAAGQFERAIKRRTIFSEYVDGAAYDFLNASLYRIQMAN